MTEEEFIIHCHNMEIGYDEAMRDMSSIELEEESYVSLKGSKAVPPKPWLLGRNDAVRSSNIQREGKEDSSVTQVKT
jgi:hypothetical protein